MDNNNHISIIERQNVLNNRFAIEKIQKALNVDAMFFDGQYCFTKQMVANFYEVEERTIERYLESHDQELKHNGYFLCRGKLLKELKLQFAPVINVGSKTTVTEWKRLFIISLLPILITNCYCVLQNALLIAVILTKD